jgi:Domain of unknown function (DUF3395)
MAVDATRQKDVPRTWNSNVNDDDDDDDDDDDGNNDGLLHLERRPHTALRKRDDDYKDNVYLGGHDQQIILPPLNITNRDRSENASDDDDDDDDISINGIRSRRAIVEIPMRVVAVDSDSLCNYKNALYTEPNSRMSMQTTFPIWQHKQQQRKVAIQSSSSSFQHAPTTRQRLRETTKMPLLDVVLLGQLSSAFWMRGNTGFTHGDAQVTCRLTPAPLSRPRNHRTPRAAPTPPVALVCNAGVGTTAGSSNTSLSTGATLLLNSSSSSSFCDGNSLGHVGTTAVSTKYSTSMFGGLGGQSPPSTLNLSASRRFSSCIFQSSCSLCPSSSFSSSSVSSLQQQQPGNIHSKTGSRRTSGGIFNMTLFSTSLTFRTVQPWTVSLGWNPSALTAQHWQIGDASSSSPFLYSSTASSMLSSSLSSIISRSNWFLSWSTSPTIVLSPLLRVCLCLGFSTHGAWNVCAIWKQPLLVHNKRQTNGTTSTRTSPNCSQDAAGNSSHHSNPQRQLSIGVEKRVLSSSTTASTGLVWLFTWTDNDLTVRVPVSLCPTFLNAASSLSSCTQLVLQGLLVSLLSALMQHVVAQVLLSVVFADDDDNRSRTRTMPDASTAQTAANAAMSRRKDALQQQNLMKRQASTRMRAEEEKNGLVIETAIYRLVRATTTATDATTDHSIPLQQQQHRHSLDDASFLNVTVPLQFWVSESSLQLPAMSKKHLLGFHELYSSATRILSSPDTATSVDIEESVPLSLLSSFLSLSSFKSFSQWFSGFYTLRQIKGKKNDSTAQQRPILYVRYKFEGVLYEITVQDTQSLKLPSPRATRVPGNSSGGGDE